jgi:flagellar biosynthesis anti-sigma factor FlgM
MGVRINRPVLQGNVGRTTNRAAAKKKDSAEAKSAGSDSVELSAKDNAASIARTASRSVGEVDEAKVAEIRNQLASGEYKADLKVVAEKIIAEAVVLSGKK